MQKLLALQTKLQNTKLGRFILNHGLFIALIAFSIGVLAVNLRMNFFRYTNFDFGKYDLGNMAQMLWYTLYRGKVMYLTDYFGTVMPRWGFSHVDPIILIILPFFALIPNAMTLVVFQLVIVIFSSLLVYKIAELELKSKIAAFLMGMAYLFYPAVGFLTAWTGYHGVTAAIPFMFAAFYLFEKMYYKDLQEPGKGFTKKGLIAFWILLILVMAGKEQLPLYVAFYGLFVWFFRQQKKLGISMLAVGITWFIVAFFVIIPAYADYRIDGYNEFVAETGLTSDIGNDVTQANYFLNRYAAFGSTYSEVITSMLTKPSLVVQVFFDGDNPENFNKTFMPVLYLPFLYPPLLVLAAIDFAINYLTTEGGIGTAEITNHRVSMIVPIMMISTIYAISLISRVSSSFFKKAQKAIKIKYGAILFISALVLGSNIYTTFQYNNPVYLWLTQAVSKRIPNVFAKTAEKEIYQTDYILGDRIRLTPLEDKDRECAAKIVDYIPDDASVSGPDYLGAHLGLREVYGIFPALVSRADYVVVDVFAQKVLRILDVDVSLVRNIVGDLKKDPNYKLEFGCGNMFVFKNVGEHGKSQLLQLQEAYEYEEKYNFEIINSLHLVDFEIPQTFEIGQLQTAKFVYIKRDADSLAEQVLFMSFINKENGEIYQAANLPSFSLRNLRNWQEDIYYIEDVELSIPSFVETGDYKVFLGMSNKIRTRSIYLGDVVVTE